MGSPATSFLKVVKRSRDLLLEFWDPLHISGTDIQNTDVDKQNQ